LAKSLYFVTGIAPAAIRAADAHNIMHPFRTSPDPIDSVACARCGHPAWAHCVSDACAECESHDAATACTVFALAGFTAVTSIAYEEYSLR
jgi:hypothetical protein